MEFVPDSHRHGSVLLASKEWLASLAAGKALSSEADSFPVHPHLSPEDVSALLAEGKSPDDKWILVDLDVYHRKRSFVSPVPSVDPARRAVVVDDPTFDETVSRLNEENFSNLWAEAHHKWVSPHKTASKTKRTDTYGREHDVVLLQVLSAIYGPDCPVVHASKDASAPPPSAPSLLGRRPEDFRRDHLASALAVVVEDATVSVLRPHSRFSVRDALRFSSAFFGESPSKTLFVAYQLLTAFSRLHSMGLCVGDVSLHDAFIDDRFLVRLRSDPASNLVKLDLGGSIESLKLEKKSSEAKRLVDSLKASLADGGTVARDEEQLMTVFSGFLESVTKMWMSCQLSNFDYLLFLNYLSGRTFSNPNHYPVMPWVKDFTSEAGGWRDLSKSKYRLNKGDQQLDLTFNSLTEMANSERAGGGLDDAFSPAPVGSQQPQPNRQQQHTQAPHHVSDVLSEITLYVYKARRTPRSVLCRHVRNRWVPAEYPSSMQRLQEWTPDECIPEFFSDPQIFLSVHDDLPDLEIPPWCAGPEEFVSWHRDALEGQHVSQRLHQWIDLTFGYKLSGGSAVRAKNVCLNLVDGHTDLRLGGVLQLFQNPHPSRGRADPYGGAIPPKLSLLAAHSQRKDGEEDSSVDFTKSNNRSSKTSLADMDNNPEAKTISLPKDFDPLARLTELENQENFFHKSSLRQDDQDQDSRKEIENYPKTTSQENFKDVAARRKTRDMRVLACLIMELFLPKKFQCVGRHADLEARTGVCRFVLRHEAHSVPLCVRAALRDLLQDEFPCVSELGLPPPTAAQLLLPQTSPLVFPSHFSVFARVLRLLDEVSLEARLSPKGDDEAVVKKVAEFKVKLVASELQELQQLEDLRPESMEIMLPTVKALFADTSTAILTAWYLLDQVSKTLGRKSATRHLLHHVLFCYDGNAQTSKHLKLYHRTFLQILIVRFGTDTFLKYFSTYLIEAVGGYKDYEDDSSKPTRRGLERGWIKSEEAGEGEEDDSGRPSSQSGRTSALESPKEDDKRRDSDKVEETFAEGEVFAFDNIHEDEAEGGGDGTSSEAKKQASQGVIYIPPVSNDNSDDEAVSAAGSSTQKSGGNISQVAEESVLWLAHRIGPVLTARYLTRNLLRMLNLCYSGPEGVAPSAEPFPDRKIRVSVRRVHGDVLAQRVLETLAEIACLYGDQIILLQYFPYAWDLVKLCRKKLTANLEGGLLGVMALTRHIVAYLSDSVLMNELPDNLLVNVLFPVLQLATTRSVSFPCGWRARQTLAFRLLDLVYLIGLRIGEEMSRSHLTPLCSAFFSGFDKVYGPDGEFLKIADESPEQRSVSKEISRALTPELAYSAYVAFYNLMGRAHLESSIMNMDAVRSLCLLFQQQERGRKLPRRPATFHCLRAFPGATDSPSAGSGGGAGGGNKIGVSSDSHAASTSAASAEANDDLHALISKEMSSPSRHLKGNWLAYWEHETGRGADDAFSLKQIRLQGFAGHGAGIKCIGVINNENSFFTGSRDKTVKLWSLRSLGDGTSSVNSQWSYTGHKRSVFAAFFLEGIRLASTCDSTLHVWDPFVGSAVCQVDPARLGPVHVVAPLADPAPLLMAATQDSLLHLVDCRVGSVVTDLKVSLGSTGLVRVLSTSWDGRSMLVGHTSGSLSVLDLRTGRLRSSWKGHEGEVLSLLPLPRGEFLSTSLDQTVSVWKAEEGKLRCSLAGAQEPVHCVEYVEDTGDLVTATTANRIAVRHGTAADSKLQSHKLRSDVVKGGVTAMKVLPMNRMVLLGQDGGNVTLIC